MIGRILCSRDQPRSHRPPPRERRVVAGDVNLTRFNQLRFVQLVEDLRQTGIDPRSVFDLRFRRTAGRLFPNVGEYLFRLLIEPVLFRLFRVDRDASPLNLRRVKVVVCRPCRVVPSQADRLQVLSPVENGGAFRGKIRVKMAAHM